MSGPLDRLYQELAGATGAEQQLADQQRADLEQIQSAERELQEQRAGIEDGTEEAARIDDQLDELHRAYLTITDQLEDDDDHGDAQPERQDPDGAERGGRPGDGEQGRPGA